MEGGTESIMLQVRHKRVNMSLVTADDFVHINVCGMIYETLKSTLEIFPMTLLGDEDRRRRFYVNFKNAYFFDRHRECFEAILYYYQSGGSLVRPTHIPMDLFAEEVRFFGISEDALQELQTIEGYVDITAEETEDNLPKNPWQRKIWKLVDCPESSLPARIIAIFSILVILLSISTFCLESIPKYHAIYNSNDHEDILPDGSEGSAINSTAQSIISNSTVRSKNNTASKSKSTQFIKQTMTIIEIFSIIWFSLEYLLRLLSSANKWKFFKSFLNLIDLAAILPYFLILAIESKQGSSFAVIRVARLVRVFRVFKLSRHSMGLQTIGNTLKASVNELGMIVFIMGFSVLIFSSAIYYAENETNRESFKSIPASFWYSVVTMTTVGYGDRVPITVAGKCIGSMCAISGVLTIAMVVPIIITNFEFFYKRDRMQQQQHRKDVSLMNLIQHEDFMLTPDVTDGTDVTDVTKTPKRNDTI